jgi:anti-sigma factor (TIGR02949 family)
MTELNDCDEVLAEIQFYVDGEVTEERRTALESHLHGCPPCLHRAEFQAKLKTILRSKCRTEVPDHLWVRIRRIIRSHPDPRV